MIRTILYRLYRVFGVCDYKYKSVHVYIDRIPVYVCTYEMNR